MNINILRPLPDYLSILITIPFNPDRVNVTKEIVIRVTGNPVKIEVLILTVSEKFLECN